MSTTPETSLDHYSKTPYSDQFELMADMGSPRYNQSEAFRACVAAKIAISTGIGTDNTYSGGVEHSVSIGTGSLHGAAPAEDQAAIEQEFAASRPEHPMAVNPNKISL